MVDSQLLGFLIGDGWCYKDVHRNYIVGFTQSIRNSDVMNCYKHLLSHLGRVYQKHRHRKNAFDVYVKNKRLLESFKECKTRSAETFEHLTSNDKKKFIGGFVDAEATVTISRCRIYNASHELLAAIQHYLKEEVKLYAILY